MSHRSLAASSRCSSRQSLSRVLLRSTLLLTSIALVGCGLLSDRSLAERENVQTELESIGTKYTTILASVSVIDDPQDAANSIDGLVSKLGSLNGASTTQKRVADNLSAAMSTSSASLRARAIVQLELAQLALREQIGERIATASRIAAGADAQSTADYDDVLRHIGAARNAHREFQNTASQAIANLEQPRAQMEQQQTRSAAKLATLQRDAAQLRQRANDAGPLEGYAFVEEAAGIKTQAIPVKSALATAEFTLSLHIEPDLELTKLEYANAAATVAASNKAETTAQERNASTEAATKGANDAARKLLVEAAAEIETYRDRETNELQPLLTQALGNLQRAGRGGGSGSAALVAFNAARLTGDLHAMRATATAADASLLAAAAQLASNLGENSESMQAHALAASEANTAALEDARTAYTKAIERLAYNYNVDAIAARTATEALLKSLDGVVTEKDDFELGTPAPAPAGGSTGGGFATPQGLCDFINSFATATVSPELMQRALDAVHVQDPAKKAEMAAPDQMQQGFASLAQLANQPGGLKVANVAGSSGKLVPASSPPPGMPVMSLVISRVNGKWFIDMDKTQAALEKLFKDALENAGGDGGGRGGRGGGGGRGGFSNN